MPIHLIVAADFDGDGFVELIEPQYIKSVKWDVGFRTALQTFAPDNVCEIQLINTDGRFTPENPSGVFAGQYRPFVPFAIGLSSTDAEWTIPLGTETNDATRWAGWVSFPKIAWKADGAQTGEPIIRLIGYGVKRWLDMFPGRVTPATNATVGALISEIHDSVPIPSFSAGVNPTGSNQIGVGEGRTLAEYGQIEYGTAAELIANLAKADRGRVYTDEEGVLRFDSYLEEIEGSPTSNLGLGDIDGVSSGFNISYKAKEADYAYADEARFATIVRMTSHPRAVAASEVLWEHPQLTIPANQVHTIEVTLRRNNGQLAGASSLAATYTTTSGSGTLTVEEKGTNALLSFDTTTSGVAWLMDDFELEGVPILDLHQLTVEVQDDAAVALYGPIIYEEDMGPLTEYDVLRNAALTELNKRKVPLGELKSVTVVDVLNSEFVEELANRRYKVGDTVHAQFDSLYHDADYIIVGTSSSYDKLTLKHQMFLQRREFDIYWFVGVTGRSEIGVTTTVYY